MLIKSSERQSYSGWVRAGHSRWWLKIDDKDIYIKSVRGSEYLEVDIDDDLVQDADVIEIGVGTPRCRTAKRHDCIREIFKVKDLTANV